MLEFEAESLVCGPCGYGTLLTVGELVRLAQHSQQTGTKSAMIKQRNPLRLSQSRYEVIRQLGSLIDRGDTSGVLSDSQANGKG